MFLANYEEIIAVLLFSIGLSMLVFSKNLLKKVMGLNIMDTGVYLLLASLGYIAGAKVPIVPPTGDVDVTKYINPIPSGLVLTGIVVSVSVSALMLSLTVRLYGKYHTLDLDEIYRLAAKREKEREGEE